MLLMIVAAMFRTIQKKLVFPIPSTKFVASSCKALAISGLFLYLFSIFISNHLRLSSCNQPFNLLFYPSQNLLVSSSQSQPINTQSSPTNISHIVFGISGSANGWRFRRTYIEAWWRPNITRGYLFLDRAPPLPWPSSSPPFRVSEDTSKLEAYSKHVARSVIRIARVILETLREGDEGVRWYVMSDDDTVFFVENLVDVLAKYDHNKYFYIGSHSECPKSNFDHSFEMAFGGGGFAVSYPLAAMVVKNLDECIKRYPYFYASDYILQSCLFDLGVSLTLEKGFHQIDLHNDISGFLSAHPQSPLVSLHHLDAVDPIFSSLNRHESINHLMKAAKIDQSRLLQQTICYHKQSNWSFSISWGYSAHIYEKIYPPSILKRPLETFRPWKKNARAPFFMFNTRVVTDDPCEAPHVYFFNSIENNTIGNQIVTRYVRASPRGLPTCSLSGNHSADHISEILVFSSAIKLDRAETRRECCDIVHVTGMNITEVKFRACASE